MSDEKELKDRWDMTQQERDKQDTKTMLVALLVIVPLILVGFFVTAYVADQLVNGFGYEGVHNIGAITIYAIIALVIFGIGIKVGKKIGLDK